ncbi:helix-turn-helix domain-containing protein [Roseisolibacter sp. H3M3-2]|uniref:helix-turn-helix domain-containing protein n=1 Tax=Roseisolibacter sp. H3M3-2 TaxID=3031323 RepID=UPI0023DC3B63|nr:helix-turn-helix domain-containing protein [Roseisolibacter sp. H3M3-2]MDF1506377.1 IS630 transposase-related protein [Roseisolibacter sp. H3M3-2]
MVAPNSQEAEMAAAYSQDLRDRVLAAAHAGLTHGAVARRFAVGESTVRGWLRRERRTGSAAPRPNRGGRPKLDAAGDAALRTLVAERNDRTLAELAAGLRERAGVGVSVMAVWRACERLALRRKKKEPRPRRADA